MIRGTIAGILALGFASQASACLGWYHGNPFEPFMKRTDYFVIGRLDKIEHASTSGRSINLDYIILSIAPTMVPLGDVSGWLRGGQLEVAFWDHRSNYGTYVVDRLSIGEDYILGLRNPLVTKIEVDFYTSPDPDRLALWKIGCVGTSIFPASPKALELFERTLDAWSTH